MSTHILPWPRPLRALPLLFLPFLALGCSGSSTEPEGAPPVIESLPRPLTSQETLLARAGNDFAFDLLKQVAAAESGNLFLSPVSASMALGMAASGAEGETFCHDAGDCWLRSLSPGGDGGGGTRDSLERPPENLDPRWSSSGELGCGIRKGFR